jgi:hypothetical protein
MLCSMLSSLGESMMSSLDYSATSPDKRRALARLKPALRPLLAAALRPPAGVLIILLCCCLLVQPLLSFIGATAAGIADSEF